jgi:hypothetical protein
MAIVAESLQQCDYLDWAKGGTLISVKNPDQKKPGRKKQKKQTRNLPYYESRCKVFVDQLILYNKDSAPRQQKVQSP